MQMAFGINQNYPFSAGYSTSKDKKLQMKYEKSLTKTFQKTTLKSTKCKF